MTLKRILIASLVLLFSVGSLNAQTSSKDIDIRELLNKQITEIRKKQEAGKNKESIVKTAGTAPANINAAAKTNNNAEDIVSISTAVKVFILIEALLLASLLVMWLRRNRKIRRTELSILKGNIKNLREERIGTKNEIKLSKVRSTLRFIPIKIDDNGKDIIAKARKHNISKGEVHLAAKIKLLAGEYK